MSKAIQALFSGMLVTFILDFFLFLGIKINYIDTHDINLYYNILFADNQNVFLFFLLSIILGYLIMYSPHKLSLSVLSIFSLLVLLTLIEPVGKMVGEYIFMQRNVTIQTKKFSYHGDIYYVGRTNVTFYDYKFKKILNLDKNQIVSEYK